MALNPSNSSHLEQLAFKGLRLHSCEIRVPLGSALARDTFALYITMVSGVEFLEYLLYPVPHLLPLMKRQ